jgi:hypothetical protein
MMGPALFTSVMTAVLLVLLAWLVMGGMHRSAHPRGERRQFEFIIDGWNHRAANPRGGLPPRGYLYVGPDFAEDRLKVELVWSYSPAAEPYLCATGKGLVLSWPSPRPRRRRRGIALRAW